MKTHLTYMSSAQDDTKIAQVYAALIHIIGKCCCTTSGSWIPVAPFGVHYNVENFIADIAWCKMCFPERFI